MTPESSVAGSQGTGQHAPAAKQINPPTEVEGLT